MWTYNRRNIDVYSFLWIIKLWELFFCRIVLFLNLSLPWITTFRIFAINLIIFLLDYLNRHYFSFPQKWNYQNQKHKRVLGGVQTLRKHNRVNFKLLWEKPRKLWTSPNDETQELFCIEFPLFLCSYQLNQLNFLDIQWPLTFSQLLIQSEIATRFVYHEKIMSKLVHFIICMLVRSRHASDEILTSIPSCN